MLRQKEAPTSCAGTGGAMASEALRAQRRCHSIAKPTDFGNQDVQAGVCLDELLDEFVALNHDRYYSGQHASQTTQEPVRYPLWCRTRVEITRRAAKLVLQTDHCPDWLSDFVLPRAETWALKAGH